MEQAVLITCMVLILLICVFGLVGNLLNVLILLRKEMRSSTNYFLLGLTFSDIALLVLSFVRTLNNVVPYLHGTPEAFNIFIFLWDWICTSGTRYFTVVVSLERCIAVCFPLKARVWISEERSKLYAISVLIFTIGLAITALFYDKYAHAYGFEIFAALVLHFLPFVLIAVLNTFIYLGIRNFKKTRKTLTSSETKEISITKMLLAVVIVFGFCHSFEIIRRILNYTNYFDFTKYEYYDYTISYLADTFYVLNSSVNFIIYYLMVEQFRKEFFKLITSFRLGIGKAKDLSFTNCSPENSSVSTTSSNLAV